MNGWTVGWIVWLVYFAALEGVAVVRRKRGDTLSEHVWVWFGTAPGTKANTWAYVRRFALLAFLAWVSVHFMTGGRFV